MPNLMDTTSNSTTAPNGIIHSQVHLWCYISHVKFNGITSNSTTGCGIQPFELSTIRIYFVPDE